MDDLASNDEQPLVGLKTGVAAMGDEPHTLVRPARIRGALLRRVSLRAVLRKAPLSSE